DRVGFRYQGLNPNGSLRNIAGITNEAGNVVGLMPPPEPTVEAGFEREDGSGSDGQRVFSSAEGTVAERWTAGSRSAELRPVSARRSAAGSTASDSSPRPCAPSSSAEPPGADQPGFGQCPPPSSRRALTRRACTRPTACRPLQSSAQSSPTTVSRVLFAACRGTAHVLSPTMPSTSTFPHSL